jgi:hypothetical protein
VLAPLLMLLIAVSRWALRLDGVLAERMYDSYPDLLARLPDVELTGDLPPVVPDGVSGYTHRPGELVRRSQKLGWPLRISSASRACAPLRQATCRIGWLTPPLQIVLDTGHRTRS